VRDPSKAAPKATQYVVIATLWAVWDSAFFFGAGHPLIGAVILSLPLAYLGLARRASRR